MNYIIYVKTTHGVFILPKMFIGDNMSEIGTLLKLKQTQEFGTVTAKYVKLIRDASDWEAM